LNILYRQNKITIDLDAIKHNYLLMKQHVGKQVRVMAVVKANAYGHGILEVARTIQAAGGNDLAVAIPEEGILLREAGITTNILVLGAAMPIAADAAVMHGLTMTLFEPHMVTVLEQAAQRHGKPAYAHIKVDTGMNRIGLRTQADAERLRAALAEAPHVRITGIYTHFADADHLSSDGAMEAYSRMQLEKFRTLRSCFDRAIPAHAANSAMSLVAREADFDCIREGISLYGYPPVPTPLPFRRALSWESEVVHVKDIKAGESVGYGCTFTAEQNMRIATVSVGYGDGYHRVMSNRGQMLVRGKRADILGRICMDQTMIDVTNIAGAEAGTKAVLIGEEEGQSIGADELARWADTISYEILLSITTRVPRVYLPAGQNNA